MDGVQGYGEDQIALVIWDESKFAEWVPVILGTPDINRVVNVMKEKEIDALAMPVWHICYPCVGHGHTVERPNLRSC